MSAEVRTIAIVLAVVFGVGLILMVGMFGVRDGESAYDWPTWRYDAGRTGNCPNDLPKEMHLQWILDLPKPKPCWPPTQHRLQYDLSYEPVAMGRRLFVPSMVRDCVSAYDTRTGERLWRTYVDGPVRFAPLAWEGKVYFVSDDGHLYCLRAEDGAVLWKFRGGPSDYKLLGNERFVSMWPARGGPVLYDDTVYFAASIWPFMGTFIYALDPNSGEEIWRNTGSGCDFLLQPHSSPAFAGVAPQGYLAATENKLFLSSGRSVPAVYDRHTGEFLYFENNTKRGRYDFIAGDEYFFNDGIVYRTEDGSPVAEADVSVLTPDTMIGIDQQGWIRSRTKDIEQTEYIDKRGETQRRNEFSIQGQAQSLVEKVFFKAGSRLYCGAPGLVAAVDISSLDSRDTKGAFAWQAKVDGEPWSMLTGDKRLFVVTKEGRIYCFGKDEVRPRTYTEPGERQFVLDEQWTEIASEYLDTAGVNEGYCLVLGLGTGHLAEELLRQSDLYVIGLDRDAETVESLRKKFDDDGLYGERISLHVGDILNVSMSPYLAKLVVSEDPESAGYGEAGFIERVFRVLRPYGGTACLSTGSRSDVFIREARNLNLPNAVLRAESPFVLLERAGALPGSAEWTHQYGDISNTVCSKDKLVKPPLAPLWFGGPSHADVLPRHGHGPPQQIVDGRLIIQGINVLSARDVYTGRTLWKKELPHLNTFEMYYDETYNPDPFDRSYNQVHIPGANAYGTNFVVTPERIYLIQEEKCLIIDTETGRTVDEWTLPLDMDLGTPNWGYIGVYDDLLIAGAAPLHISKDDPQSVRQLVPGADPIEVPEAEQILPNHRFGKGSRSVVVMDRFSGRVLWSQEAEYTFRHNTIVAGNEKLFCVDSLSDARFSSLKRRGFKTDTQPSVIAFDIRSGDELWRDRENVFGTWLGYSTEYDVLLEGGSRAGDRARDEVGRSMAAYRGRDGEVLWQHNDEYSGPPILYHDRIITQTGGSNQQTAPAKCYNLLTGERVMTTHPLTGETVPWGWIRYKGCNTAIASEHLLTFRSAAAAYVSLPDGQGVTTMGGFRSSCTSNLIAADGVLNAPDYTRTCTCSYQNQTSLALIHMPPDAPENPCVESWSFDHYWAPQDPAPVKRIGINFGAPGNRLSDDGTLWVEFPSVGGPSPDIPIRVESDDAKLFRYHMSRVKPGDAVESEGNPAWVAASGVEGEMKISIRVFLQPAAPDANELIEAFERNAFTDELTQEYPEIVGSYDTPLPYTVRLHFVEPEDVNVGDRVYDIYLQGEKVKENFDILETVENSNQAVVLGFEGIPIQDDLDIELKTAIDGGSEPPILCGVEILAD